jgi:hypothetical protein
MLFQGASNYLRFEISWCLDLQSQALVSLLDPGDQGTKSLETCVSAVGSRKVGGTNLDGVIENFH